ncbi:MAG TPA: hypothetical protein VGR20_12995 [Acidimicrobiia bacterium]|nr:hypothetical protein [Acidimicrobiia bacterium]
MQRLARFVAAVLILTGGAIHLQLWRGGYRGIPRIGPWFMANVLISGLLAGLLVVRNDARVALAGIVFSLASLGALVMSRTIGIFGFTETAWTGSVLRATGAEVGAVVFLIVILALRRSQRIPVPAPATPSGWRSGSD